MKKSICCRQCGNMDLVEEIQPTGSIHYSRLDCFECTENGRFVAWGIKPGNENKRRDKNFSWKKLHRERDGQFICTWCGVDEKLFSDNLGWKFQCDHIKPISDGGQDIFENTQILCFVCHGDKTARRKQRDLIYQSMFGGTTDASDFDGAIQHHHKTL